jgi:deoxyribodipyrimidine photo-lyase
VPELSEVPDAVLQEPWRWDGAARLLGRAYPEPIVDVKAAARDASARVWGVRRGADFRAEAERIVKKHASRKDPGAPMRFRRDPEPRGPEGRGAGTDPHGAQLKFDL